MIPDLTPRELLNFEQSRIKNGGGTLWDIIKNTTVSYNGESWPLHSPEDVAAREQYPLLGKLINNFYELYRELSEIENGLSVLSKYENELAEHINFGKENVDSPVIKWFNGELRNDEIYPEKNNEECFIELLKNEGIKNYIGSERYNIFKDYPPAQIEAMVIEYVKEALNFCDMNDEITIMGAKVYGSRTRNDFTSESDLDVLIEYKGDYKEYMFFNLLHDEEEPFEICGIPIDINPIRAEESGTIEEYYARVCDFKKRKPDFDRKLSVNSKIYNAKRRLTLPTEPKNNTDLLR